MTNRQVDDGRLWLQWLTRLRWVALVAQTVTVGFAFPLIQPWQVFVVWALVMAGLLAGNLRAMAVLAKDEPVGGTTLLWQLGLDVFALTTFFVCAGGPENPFVILYVIHVAMGAIMLRPRDATLMTLVVLLCYLLLHTWSLPLHFENHTLPPNVLHTLGQIVAFMVVVPSLAVFVVGLATALRGRTQLLLEARDRTSRTDRLRSVGTLAAGAAHELNTPLSTIGLRARRVGRRHEDDDTVRDVEVIKEQLARCTRIVQQLLAGAGDPSAVGLERAPLAKLVAESVKMWTMGSVLDVEVHDYSGDAEVKLPRVAFSQALINLLENAREAQEEAGTTDALRITLRTNPEYVFLELRDHGTGLPEGTDQVGTPFYTTKQKGTGLGVFVARQVADGAGGGLRYVDHQDGTTAEWWFPVEKSRRPAQEEQ